MGSEEQRCRVGEAWSGQRRAEWVGDQTPSNCNRPPKISTATLSAARLLARFPGFTKRWSYKRWQRRDTSCSRRPAHSPSVARCFAGRWQCATAGARRSTCFASSNCAFLRFAAAPRAAYVTALRRRRPCLSLQRASALNPAASSRTLRPSRSRSTRQHHRPTPSSGPSRAGLSLNPNSAIVARLARCHCRPAARRFLSHKDTLACLVHPLTRNRQQRQPHTTTKNK